MEIKIDTTKDSKEHIQHMIDFLQRFVGSQGQSYSSTDTSSMTDMFSQDAPSAPEQPQEGIFGLFDSPATPPPSEQVSAAEPEEKEKTSDNVEIIPY